MQAHDVDRVKVDDRDYRCTCAQCGETFEARRSDASFCSSKCRVAFSREPKKLANAIESVDAFGRQVLAYSHKYSHNQRMFEAILELQKRVNTALANFEKD